LYATCGYRCSANGGCDWGRKDGGWCDDVEEVVRAEEGPGVGIVLERWRDLGFERLVRKLGDVAREWGRVRP